MSISNDFYVFYGIRVVNLTSQKREQCDQEFNHMVITPLTMGLMNSSDSEEYLAIRSSIVHLNDSGTSYSLCLSDLPEEHPEWDFIMDMVAKNFGLDTEGNPGYYAGVRTG